MPLNWKKFKEGVKGKLSDTAVTTRKYFKIGKGKLDIRKINNSLNDTFQELGIEVNNQIGEEIKGDIRDNPKVKSLIEEINTLKQLIKDEELEIKVLKKEAVPNAKTNADNNNSPDVKAEITV